MGDMLGARYEDKNLLFYAKDEVCDLVQTGTSYGIHKGDIQAVDIVLNPKGSFYTITIPKKNLRINNVFLPLIGEHQIKNSLAVFGLALELGFDPYRIVEQFANYRGVKRRCERVLNQNKALVFLDYGHHPLELEATFNGLKHQFQRPLVVIFEPHKYTRTKSFFLEFVQVLKGCDTLFLLKTYPAGEVFDFDGSSEKLAQQLNLDLLDELDLSLAIEKYKDKPVTILFIGAGKIDLFCKECFS